ncbi:MAG: RNA polymerase sigma factor [Pirellulales bacterium]|nr:RNA polymerase sigma factor [Pirellulales bacterium]
MNELLAAHLDRVLRFLHRLTGDPHEAADLAQETFLRAWRGRNGLRDSTAARAWLLRIAANTFRDWLRKRSRSPNVEALTSEPPCGASVSATSNHTVRLQHKEDASSAIVALQTLPPRQREVLTLHACEELSIDEIAHVLQIDRRAVKSSLSVARAAMRRKFAHTTGTTGDDQTPQNAQKQVLNHPNPPLADTNR